MVNVLLKQVLQPVGSLSSEEVMKMKLDVVSKMNFIFHD
jgi:hypothetical protein